MTAELQTNKYIKRLTEYWMLLLFIATAVFFEWAIPFLYGDTILGDSYVVFHTLIEGSSVFISVMVFLVAYHAYTYSKKLKTLVLGIFFINVGLIDVFHALTYKEIDNITLVHTNDMALKFYIAGRMLCGIGLLVAALISMERVAKVSRFTLITAFVILNLYFIINILKLGDIYFWFNASHKNLYLYQFINICIYTASVVLYGLEYGKTKEKIYQLFIGALVILSLSEAILIWHYDDYGVYGLMGHVFRIVGVYMIFRAVFYLCIRKPYNELSEAQKEMSIYTSNLEGLVEQRTQEIREKNQRLLKDVGYARDIKKVVLPPKYKDYPNAELFSKCIPSESLTGQFCNMFEIDNKNVALLAGSLPYNGISSTMLTIFFNQTIKALISSKKNDPELTIYPHLVIQAIINSYKELSFESGVSLLFATYNVDSNKLTYSETGDNIRISIFSREGLAAIPGMQLKEQNSSSGAEKESTITSLELTLEKGQTLVIYAEDRNSQLETESKSVLNTIEKTVLLNYNRPLIEMQEKLSESLVDKLYKSEKKDVVFIIIRAK